MYEPSMPPAFPAFTSPVVQEKERGRWLTWVLVWAGVSNAFVGAALAFFLLIANRVQTTVDADELSHQGPAIALLRKAMLVGLMICAGNIACVYGTWTWKRWGAYGLLALNIFSSLVAWRLDATSSFGSWISTIAVVGITMYRSSDFE